MSQFRSQRYDDAIDTFLELDFNPAKVVALYPESVAGRLAVLQDRWISLYGGPKPPGNESSSPEGSASAPEGDKDKHKDSDGGERNPTDLLDALSGGSIGGRFRKTGLGMFLPAQKDDDTASIIAKRKFTVDGQSQILCEMAKLNPNGPIFWLRRLSPFYRDPRSISR